MWWTAPQTSAPRWPRSSASDPSVTSVQKSQATRLAFLMALSLAMNEIGIPDLLELLAAFGQECEP